jgi:hypothetical protein
MSQTVAKSNFFQWGSVKVEVGETIESLDDMGSGQGATCKETWDQVEFESDNGGSCDPEIKNQAAEFSMDMNEHDLVKLAMLRGGIDILTDIPGEQVVGATQLLVANTYGYNAFIPFSFQNGDGTCPTVTSVVGAADGALVSETDYFKAKDSHGIWGIFIKDSATVTTLNQNVTITTTYIPSAGKKLTTGGKTTISARVLRITNTHAASGKYYRLTFYKAYNSGGLELSFQPDNADAPTTWKMTVKAKKDVTREAGDQLYELIRQNR